MRPPRSLPPLTLFHDPASPLSRSLLARLPALLSPSSSAAQSQARLGPGEAYLQRARDGETPLAELEVRSKRTEPPTETQWRLCVGACGAHVCAAVLTPCRSIRQYASQANSAASLAVSEHLAAQHEAPAEAAPAAGDGDTHKAVQGSPASVPDGKTRARLLNAKREHAERTAMAAKGAEQASAEQQADDGPAAAADDDELPIRLRDGPLLVHWDAGLVATDERGVEQILRTLEGGGQAPAQASWCVVA